MVATTLVGQLVSQSSVNTPAEQADEDMIHVIEECQLDRWLCAVKKTTEEESGLTGRRDGDGGRRCNGRTNGQGFGAGVGPC